MGDRYLPDEIAQRMRSNYVGQEDRLRLLDGSDLDKAVAVVAAELQDRLSRQGLDLPPRTRSRMSKWPLNRATSVIQVEANPREMMIIRAVARTWAAAQFGCSTDGSVFTADTDG